MSAISSVGGSAAFAVQATRSQQAPPSTPPAPTDGDGDNDGSAASPAAPGSSASKVNLLA